MLYAVHECRYYDIWRRQDRQYLGVLAKLRKATIRFAMSVRPPARPHAINPLPPKGFSWNSTFKDFSNNR